MGAVNLFGFRRKWVAASSEGPEADATIDHPGPMGSWIEVDQVPLLIAPDPGGVAPRAASTATPVAHEHHGLSTGAKVGIGLGVAGALGGIVYAVTRSGGKKKRK